MIFFTYINITLFLMTFLVERCPFFVEFVRATSLLVFVGWLLVFGFYGYRQIVRFYDEHLGSKLPLAVVISIDLMCHVLPVLVLGLPADPVAVLCGVAATLVWYIAVRDRIHDMYYLPEDHLVYRDWFVVWGSIGIALGALISLNGT